MPIQSYRDLVVWQKAMSLVLETYELCSALPTDERFGLIAQMRRAAVSVPANIAEGHSRMHRNDFAQFVAIARGSLAELETHLDIAEQLGYRSNADLKKARALADQVGRMLSTLHRRLKSRV